MKRSQHSLVQHIKPNYTGLCVKIVFPAEVHKPHSTNPTTCTFILPEPARRLISRALQKLQRASRLDSDLTFKLEIGFERNEKRSRWQFWHQDQRG